MSRSECWKTVVLLLSPDIAKLVVRYAYFDFDMCLMCTSDQSVEDVFQEYQHDQKQMDIECRFCDMIFCTSLCLTKHFTASCGQCKVRKTCGWNVCVLCHMPVCDDCLYKCRYCWNDYADIGHAQLYHQDCIDDKKWMCVVCHTPWCGQHDHRNINCSRCGKQTFLCDSFDCSPIHQIRHSEHPSAAAKCCALRNFCLECFAILGDIPCCSKNDTCCIARLRLGGSLIVIRDHILQKFRRMT